MDTIEQIKSRIDFKLYLETYEGHTFRGNKTLCPFHNDHNPSMDVGFKNDRWVFYCHACKVGGDIISYLEKKHAKRKGEIIRELQDKYDINASTAGEQRFEYVYKDRDGNEVFKKLKIKKANGENKYVFYHKEGDTWKKGKGNYDAIPYNLDRFDVFGKIIICEGEKDADTITSLNTTWLGTSGPFGKSYWDDSLTEHYKGKPVVVLYDRGVEKEAEKVAKALKTKFPNANVYIAHIPLTKKNADITDYLDQFAGTETKKEKLLEVLKKGVPFEGSEDEIAETIEELAIRPIPEIERLINPFVERRGYTLVGAIKGVGKSLFVTQLALHYASGYSPFLQDDFTIEKPGNVLLIQQEVSEPGMKDRLMKMRMERVFDLQERFRQKTTTGHSWHLTENDDLAKLKMLIEKYEPDILILDPLYTFSQGGLNSDKDAAPIIEILLDLKTNYNLGLVVVHHFSNKGRDEDMIATVGKFMGASMIANSADNTIAIEFLNPKYKEQILPLPYNHYCTIEIGTRHGEWPQKFCVERKKDGLLFHKSTIWQDIGKNIIPGQIEDLLAANDGEMLQKDVIETLAGDGTRTTVRRAIDEAIKKGTITKHTLPGKGSPKILRSKG